MISFTMFRYLVACSCNNQKQQVYIWCHHSGSITHMKRAAGNWKSGQKKWTKTRGGFGFRFTGGGIGGAVRRNQGRLRQIRAMSRVGYLGVEKKFYDTGLALTALAAPNDATGGEFDPTALSMISTPALADGPSDRDGKKINILNVSIDGLIRTTAQEVVANPPQGTTVFVALVLDTQTNGAQLNSEDVYKNSIAEGTLASNPQRNLLFGPRFRVLKSKIFNLNPQSLSHVVADSFSFTGNQLNFKWFIKFPKGLVVNFNAGTTASIANVIDNSLHIIAFASSTTATPQIAYNARIRFVG